MHFQIKQMLRRAILLHLPSMFYKSHISHRGINCPQSVLARGQSPVCLSTLASANQTHSANKASWSEKGKERQRVCDAAVLPSPVNTQMYAENVSSPALISHLAPWCRLTYLQLLFSKCQAVVLFSHRED